MERRMLVHLSVTLLTNQTIRLMSGVKDIVVATKESKARCPGHVARLDDNRRSHVTKWYPRERKRLIGRPPRRWRSYVKETAGRD